ncbi:MAG: gamma-glutamyltransferase [Pirellulaceae bacterium]
MAPRAMAATSQPLATQIALDVMRRGGSAVDAAIAANAALGLMEPTGCGIGGDLFAIVWDAESQQLHGLNASGRSPKSLELAEFQRRELDSIPALGPLPVTVPGCVDGWFELHERFGRLPMDEVLAPAIGYARDGFPMTPVIGDAWRRSAPRLRRQPGFAEIYLPNGEAPADGELFRNPALADTLELIGREGRDVFYRGEIARRIDKFMRENEGFLTYEDLAAHHSEWVEPISTDYRGWTLWELPPNGQGLAALQMLNVLEGYDLRSAGFGSVEHLHWLIEAKKLAFEDRAHFYADPDFSEAPIETLLSKTYAEERRALITNRAARSVEIKAELVEGDTIYLTVADENRNMVSLIQSNYRGFGSGMCPDGLGFCLQDRGQLFDLTEGRANTYEPGKRPFHTIIPAFVTRDGQPYMAFGVMGGATQPQGHVEILLNMIDFDMNLQEAGDAPRMVHTGSSQPTGERMTDGGQVHLEEGFDYETRRGLMLRGHRLESSLGIFGGYQAILYDAEQGVYHGASDSRKDGIAAGF